MIFTTSNPARPSQLLYCLWKSWTLFPRSIPLLFRPSIRLLSSIPLQPRMWRTFGQLFFKRFLGSRAGINRIFIRGWNLPTAVQVASRFNKHFFSRYILLMPISVRRGKILQSHRRVPVPSYVPSRRSGNKYACTSVLSSSHPSFEIVIRATSSCKH